MIVHETRLPGVRIIEHERLEDERGYFARTYDVEVLGPVVQMSTSFNRAAGTLRGLHYQAAPHGEQKIVTCTRGAVWDVVVSLSTGEWIGVELSPEVGRAVVIPPDYAHGFLTLAADSEVLYAMDRPYVPGSASGLRWDDPWIGIAWPSPPLLMSDKDRSWPLHR